MAQGDDEEEGGEEKLMTQKLTWGRASSIQKK